MMYILGVITGLVASVLIAVLHKRTETAINRTVSQLSSKIAPKGAILEPQSEDLEEWVDNLPHEV